MNSLVEILGLLKDTQCYACVVLLLHSALYVVDLQRFRQVAAGDKLRGQYQVCWRFILIFFVRRSSMESVQSLANDPNSLSNLDQDLPNNMIHQVSIFSLPQEWLWCETWCSDESKAKAKTIDLVRVVTVHLYSCLPNFPPTCLPTFIHMNHQNCLFYRRNGELFVL